MKLSPLPSPSLRYDRVGTPEYVACAKPVRRIALKASYTSVYTNYQRLYAFPHVFVFDVTEYEPSGAGDAADGGGGVWDARGHYRSQRGPHSCVPQAPAAEYMFLASVGREYLVLFRDQVRRREERFLFARNVPLSLTPRVPSHALPRPPRPSSASPSRPTCGSRRSRWRPTRRSCSASA